MSDTILAIETSTAHGGVAVVRAGEVCFEKTFSSERSHNSQLFLPLREALDLCPHGLRVVVVGTGPASYTGVRIGIAVAQGLALSRGVPVIGMPSVLAVDCRRGAYRVCGDARRGSFFVAEVSENRRMENITVLDADGLRCRHREACGETPWFTFDARPPLGLEQVACVSPSAAQLAFAAAGLSDEELHQLAQQPLEPVYLSGPFVTMAKVRGEK